MSQYVVTRAARRDLVGIWEWIAEDDIDAADQVRPQTLRLHRGRRVPPRGSQSYQKVIAWFELRFLLGLTATPERTEGADLLTLCGDSLSYALARERAALPPRRQE